jgi:hypothetical protein
MGNEFCTIVFPSETQEHIIHLWLKQSKESKKLKSKHRYTLSKILDATDTLSTMKLPTTYFTKILTN